MLEQGADRHFQRLRYPVYCSDGRIATAASFHRRDICAVKIGLLGERLLGHLLRATEAAHVLAEALADVGFIHAPIEETEDDLSTVSKVRFAY